MISKTKKRVRTVSVTYAAMPGARINRTQAATIGEELSRISTERGCLKPDDVVEESKPESAPLHSHFTWDDTEAGRQWRIEEARRIIRSVRVIRDDVPPQEQPVVRAFVNVSASDTETEFEGNAYVPIRVAEQSEDYRQQLLDAAKAELRQWEHRYSDLRDYLSGVFREVDKVL
jgi:hypothetical protein